MMPLTGDGGGGGVLFVDNVSNGCPCQCGHSAQDAADRVKTIQEHHFFWVVFGNFFLQKIMRTNNSWNVDNVKRGVNL